MLTLRLRSLQDRAYGYGPRVEAEAAAKLAAEAAAAPPAAVS